MQEDRNSSHGNVFITSRNVMNSLHSFRHRIARRIVFIVLNINIVSLKITLVNLSFSVIIYNFYMYDLHRMLQGSDRYSYTVII